MSVKYTNLTYKRKADDYPFLLFEYKFYIKKHFKVGFFSPFTRQLYDLTKNLDLKEKCVIVRKGKGYYWFITLLYAYASKQKRI